MQTREPNSKPHSNNLLYKLTAPQRSLLDQWFFGENLGYTAIRKLCASEFNVRAGIAALRSYYHREYRKHTIDRIARSSRDANDVVKSLKDNPADTYQALLGVAGQIAFQKALQAPEKGDLATIREFLKVLISARREDLLAQKFAYDREKWEYDISAACLKYLGQLRTIAAEKNVDEKARVLAIRHRLFGPVLPE